MDTDPTKPRKPPVYYPRSDDLCTETEHVTIKNVLFGFKAFTTAHGVPHVDQANGLSKKVFWLVLTLTSIGVMLMQIYMITDTYTSTPVTPVVLKQSARLLTFPAVTVCNTNPVRASALQLSPALKGLVDSWEEGKKRRKRQVDAVLFDTKGVGSGADREADILVKSMDPVEKEHDHVDSGLSSEVDSLEEGKSRRKRKVNSAEFNTEGVETEAAIKGRSMDKMKIQLDHTDSELSIEVDSLEEGKKGRNRETDALEFDIEGMEFSENREPDSVVKGRSIEKIVKEVDHIDSGLGTEEDRKRGKKREADALELDNKGMGSGADREAGMAVKSMDKVEEERRHIDSASELSTEVDKVGSNNNDLKQDVADSSRRNVQLSGGTKNKDRVGRRRRSIHGMAHFCTVAYPHGTFCLIDELSTPEDSPYLCEDLGPGYELASLETYNKVYDLEQSYFFGFSLRSHTYFIGLYNDPVWGFSWLSGEGYSYNQWSGGASPQSNVTFNFVKVTIRSSGSHPWEPAEDEDMGLALCFVESYADLTTTSTESTTTTPTTTTTPLTSSTTVPPTTTTTEPSIYPDREPIREDFQQTNDFLETLADLPEELKVELGYQPSEFILDCVYDSIDCTNSEFGHFFDTTHGNCYSFNSGWNGESLSPAQRPGRSNGLSMTLNIGQYDYMPGISEIAGVVVVVHSQARMPFPEDEGVLGHPGQLTSIGLNQVSVERLGGKYSDCMEEDKDPDRNMFEEHHNVNYSAAGCYKTCYQKHLIQRCDCYDPQYPGTGTALGTAEVSVCDTRNRIQDDCMYGVLLDYIASELVCDCPIKCSEQLYTHSISRARWPALVNKDAIVTKYADKLGKLLNYSTEESYLYRNLLKIEVYFDDLNYEYIYEKPKYPFSLYIADFASLLGLWLGLSVLSIAEGLELVADLIVVSLKKILKLNRPKRREFSSLSLACATNGRPPERSASIPSSNTNRINWSDYTSPAIAFAAPEAAWTQPNTETVDKVKVTKTKNILANYTQMLALGKFKKAIQKKPVWKY